MAQPRFLFISSPAGNDRPGLAGLESVPEHVAWRLLGANNRELGRSPVWYPDLDSCREAVRTLKREIGGVTPAITAVTLPGGAWSWRLAFSGQPVAMAG